MIKLIWEKGILLDSINKKLVYKNGENFDIHQNVQIKLSFATFYVHFPTGTFFPKLNLQMVLLLYAKIINLFLERMFYKGGRGYSLGIMTLLTNFYCLTFDFYKWIKALVSINHLVKKYNPKSVDKLTTVLLRRGRNVAIQFGNTCKDGDKMINSDDQHRSWKKGAITTKLSSSSLEQKKLLAKSDLCPYL